MNNKTKLKKHTRNYTLIDCINRSGKTQKSICEEIGMSTTNFSNIVNGKICPSLVTALKISKVLNTTVDKLFEEVLNNI